MSPSPPRSFTRKQSWTRPLARSSLLSSSKFKKRRSRLGLLSARNIRARRSTSSLGTTHQYDSCRSVSMGRRYVREILADRLPAPLGHRILDEAFGHVIAVGDEAHQHQREVDVGDAPLAEHLRLALGNELQRDANELVGIASALV